MSRDIRGAVIAYWAALAASLTAARVAVSSSCWAMLSQASAARSCITRRFCRVHLAACRRSAAARLRRISAWSKPSSTQPSCICRAAGGLSIPAFAPRRPVRSSAFSKKWCCRRGLNSRPQPYQGCALPLSYGSTADLSARRQEPPTPARYGQSLSARQGGLPGKAITSYRKVMTTHDKDRAQRLAEALRENLRRRKAQARQTPPAAPETPKPSADEPAAPPRSPE